MRKFCDLRGLVGASATAALLLGFVGAASADQLAANKLSLAKIKVAMPFTVLVERMALEASLKTGGFRAEGLEVEVLRFRSWTEPVQAIAGDAAQFALGGGSLMRAVIGRKAPVRQIAMVSSLFPYAFYVKRGSDIKSIKDLRGKTIQTVRAGETLDNVWGQVLGSVGIKMSDVKRIESFNGFGTLVSGTVDVSNLNSTFTGKARKAGFVKIFDYTEWRRLTGMSVGGAVNLGWGTSLKMLNQHPDVVRAFLRTLAKATVRLKSDKAFAISILKEKPFAMNEQIASEVYDIHRDHWMLRLDPSKGDYTFDAGMVEIAMKRPKGSIDVRTVSDVRPLNEVLRELKITF